MSGTKSILPIDHILVEYLRRKNIKLYGWTLEYQNMSCELVWRKGGIDVFSTPFWEDDSTWVILINKFNKYEILEEIDVSNESFQIKSGQLSLYKFIEYYLNIMGDKLIVIDSNNKLNLSGV